MNKRLIKQVAKVIGKKRAKHELNLAARDVELTDSGDVLTAFDWMLTPQGRFFWQDIYEGEWPYMYKSDYWEI